MSGIFRHLRRSAGSPSDNAGEGAWQGSELRRTAENDARGQASESAARSQAAENETRRQAADAEARRQAGENETRRQAADAKARRQSAANEARHRVDADPPAADA